MGSLSGGLDITRCVIIRKKKGKRAAEKRLDSVDYTPGNGEIRETQWSQLRHSPWETQKISFLGCCCVYGATIYRVL
jgi:hypothetical protein